jgi:hypothetical protein
VTLAVDAVVVAGGLFLGRLVARVLRQRRQRQVESVDAEASPSKDAQASPSKDAEAPSKDAQASPRKDADPLPSRGAGASHPARAQPSRSPASRLARFEATRAADGYDIRANADELAGFVCKLGDVVVRRLEGDEAWLAGALLFAEERPVAVLYIAPDSGVGRAVLVSGPAQTTLTWLSPLAPGQLTLAGDPPQALEHAGMQFERIRRLPVRVQRLGTGAPQVGANAVMGEYAAPGLERLVVVVGAAAALAWRGVSLSESEYDVLPGGQSTLEA